MLLAAIGSFMRYQKDESTDSIQYCIALYGV